MCFYFIFLLLIFFFFFFLTVRDINCLSLFRIHALGTFNVTIHIRLNDKDPSNKRRRRETGKENLIQFKHKICRIRIGKFKHRHIYETKKKHQQQHSDNTAREKLNLTSKIGIKGRENYYCWSAGGLYYSNVNCLKRKYLTSFE